MFLDRVRNSCYGMCKHSDESFYVHIPEDGDRILHCRECHLHLSLRGYFCDFVSPWVAPNYAAEYVKWSGDDQIPCSFSTILLRNRALTTRTLSDYPTLVKGCVLLRILHSPFAFEHLTYTNEPSPDEIGFFQNTVQTELDRLIERSSRENDDFFGKSVGSIAHNALVCLRNVFTVESERYFDILIPYVKRANPGPCLQFLRIYSKDFHESVSLVRTLEKRLYESSFLHRTFAKCCAAFDAVHVATLCFLCKNDLGLVYDLVLDFASKFCYGYYPNGGLMGYKLPANTTEFKIIDLFQNHISPVSKFYRHLECFRKGGLEIADSFSDTFFKTYEEMKSSIKNNEFQPINLRFEWDFPRILFRDYSDYYAFLVALSYYDTETNLRTNNEIPVGVAEITSPSGLVSKCKTIYRFIKTSLSRVKAFHESLIESQLQRKKLSACYEDDFQEFYDEDIELEKRYYWSKDMLKRFFDCYPDFEKELVDATEWFMKLPLFGHSDLEKKSIVGKHVKDCKFEAISQFKFPYDPTSFSFENIYQCYMKNKNDDSATSCAESNDVSDNNSIEC